MSISTKHPVSILIVILFNPLISLGGVFILVLLSTQCIYLDKSLQRLINIL